MFCCGGRRACHAEASRRRVACGRIAADTAAATVNSAGHIASRFDAAADLQLLATNLYLRWRCDNWLLTGCIRNRFNHPFPAGMAIFVIGKGCATAFPDLHLPMIVVGRNCEHNCDRGRDHYSAKHSNQKYAFHFSFPHTSLTEGFEARHQAGFLLRRY
jgi:hypothetical protein